MEQVPNPPIEGLGSSECSICKTQCMETEPDDPDSCIDMCYENELCHSSHDHSSHDHVEEEEEETPSSHDHSSHDHASGEVVEEVEEETPSSHDHSSHDHAGGEVAEEVEEETPSSHDHSSHDHADDVGPLSVSEAICNPNYEQFSTLCS